MTVRDDVRLPGTRRRWRSRRSASTRRSLASVVVVPKVVLGRRDGRSWLTLTTPPGAVEVPALRRRPVAATSAPPASVTAAIPPEPQWRAAVATAVDGARRRASSTRSCWPGRWTSRPARRWTPGRSPPGSPRGSRRASPTSATVWSARHPSCWSGGSVGMPSRSSSPARSGAASTPEEDAELEASLLASPKDAVEHRLRGRPASRRCSRRSPPTSSRMPGRTLLRLANVTHLATHVEAWLARRPAVRPVARRRAAPDRRGRRHPTRRGGRRRSGGWRPHRGAATPDRSGWVDAYGDGEFAIALRCAQLDGSIGPAVGGRGHRRRLRSGRRGRRDDREVRRRAQRVDVTRLLS